MNLYMIRNRFCRMVAAVGCCLLPLSCVQEEDGVQVPEHGQGMSLQLKVRAGADNTGTAPTTEESNIHTLRFMPLQIFRMIPKTAVWLDIIIRIKSYRLLIPLKWTSHSIRKAHKT